MRTLEAIAPKTHQTNTRLHHRWGVILAGGDGTRLLSLTRRLTGEDTPKQFCALTGGDTLLHQTRQRVSRNIPSSQMLFLLTEKHRRYFAGQLRDVEPSRLLVQPHNHGTAPAIAWSLSRLNQADPDAVVAFFPSDHHFNDDAAFTDHVDLAFCQADSNPDRVILMGISPDAPEEAYGWIEPGAQLGESTHGAVFEVSRFWEKPSRQVAVRLMRRGCLWNSFVMIGRVSAFLNLLREALPALFAGFESMWATATPGLEGDAVRLLYATMPATNFSNEVLAQSSSSLAVMRTAQLGWSDLGEPQRVFSVIPTRDLRAFRGAEFPCQLMQIPA